MIIPNPWLTNLRQDRTRKFVVSHYLVHEIVHFQFPVFPRVTVDTEIVLIEKKSSKGHKVKATFVESLAAFQGIEESQKRVISHEQEDWRSLNGGVINIFLDSREKQLAAKCLKFSRPLSDFFDINVGIKPYQRGKGTPPQTADIVSSRPFDSNFPKPGYRQYLMGKDIGRYCITPKQPRYLRYGPWLAEPRPAAKFDSPIKLLMRQTGDRLVASLDQNKYLCLNNMHVLVPKSGNLGALCYLGIINSRLMNWYYRTLNPEVGEALAEVKKANVARLPMRSFGNTIDEKSAHDRVVRLVALILEAKLNLTGAKTEKDIAYYEGKCDALDREIDALVYDLYGLTPEEIALVESSAA